MLAEDGGLIAEMAEAVAKRSRKRGRDSAERALAVAFRNALGLAVQRRQASGKPGDARSDLVNLHGNPDDAPLSQLFNFYGPASFFLRQMRLNNRDTMPFGESGIQPPKVLLDPARNSAAVDVRIAHQGNSVERSA